jgi:hypothetical protein
MWVGWFFYVFLVSGCSEEEASRWRFSRSCTLPMRNLIKFLDSNTLLTVATIYNAPYKKDTIPYPNVPYTTDF